MSKSLKIIFFSLWVCCLSVAAVNIPKGVIYFDNSLTNYSRVKFIFGSDTQSRTYVMDMTPYSGSDAAAANLYQVTTSQAYNNMYRYTFTCAIVPAGIYNVSFSQLKDSISNQLHENRTATSDKAFYNNYVFVPSSGDNWAQGDWMRYSDYIVSKSVGQTAPSNTLPILYITSASPITSTEDYVSATYYLDNKGTAVSNIGSEAAPLPMLIRGRGNWTWRGFDKKPYRLKLEKGQALCGMNKSKHWALMAGADDELGFLRNPVGYMLSERLGLEWTPDNRPIEVVLNGEYIGLYFLTETIRVAPDRVNVIEQRDGCTVADSITGGWLVEIDNYEEDGQVRFPELGWSRDMIKITPKTPEILSTQQYNYLSREMNNINQFLYESNPTNWLAMVDLDQAVRFYLVQEIMEDCESYHGSCYLHKDMGYAEKWRFGPVWDFGNSFRRNQESPIYINPSFTQAWIGQMASFAVFQSKLQNVWYTFLHRDYPTLLDDISAFAHTYYDAALHDGARWPKYSNANMEAKLQNMLNRITWRVNYLRSLWGEGVNPLEEVRTNDAVPALNPSLPMYNLLGQQVSMSYKGIVIQNGYKYLR